MLTFKEGFGVDTFRDRVSPIKAEDEEGEEGQISRNITENGRSVLESKE